MMVIIKKTTILNIVLISQSSRTPFEILQKHYYCNNNIEGSCLNKQYASSQDIRQYGTEY